MLEEKKKNKADVRKLIEILGFELSNLDPKSRKELSPQIQNLFDMTKDNENEEGSSSQKEQDSLKGFLRLVDDLQWLYGSKEEIENLQSNLDEYLKNNSEFIQKWTNNDKQWAFIMLIENLNYEAFSVIIEKGSELFKEQITSIDDRGWNVYNWFINGLVQKSTMSGIVEEKDYELLKEIDNQIKTLNKKEELFNNSTLKPSEMISQVYEFESSEYCDQIIEIIRN